MITLSKILNDFKQWLIYGYHIYKYIYYRNEGVQN